MDPDLSPAPSALPLVSVTFVAWQRREALRRGIESCYIQNYPHIEILVLDNSPTDEIHRWLLAEYPAVKAIKTAHPIPLPAARNILVATAAGDLVVFHDDDSRFSSPDDVQTAVHYLQDKPHVGCLAFRVGDGKGDWNPQFDPPAPEQVYNYVACATMFRRKDFQAAGWYFEGFWLYGEERIMSLGFFGLGREIHCLPAVSIIHDYEVTGRVQDNAARYWMCDIVMIPGAALLKFPAPHVLIWYPALLAYYTAQVAVLRRRPGVAVKGMLVALRLLPKFLRERNPIPVSQYQRWRAVRGEQQRTYLQRTGRWRWYHEVLPALG